VGTWKTPELVAYMSVRSSKEKET